MTRDDLVLISGDRELLFADGFDEAILGVVERCGHPAVVVYDRDKCIQILVGEGWTETEAQEHFSFNVEGAWVGERTPAFLYKP